jgi:uncharacterized protein
MMVSFDFLRVTSLLSAIGIINIVPITVQAKVPTAKSLLWEISGNGLKRPSYLFGTMHVGCANRLALSAEQQKSLSKVQQLYLENIQSTDTTVLDPKIPEGKKLRDLMTPSQYQKVEDFFGRHALERGSLKDSGFFSLAVRAGSQLNGRGKVLTKLCKDITSKESILEEAARKQKIPISGIETAIDRKNIFSLQDGLNLLMAVISDDSSRESLDKNTINGQVLYNSQDINALFIHDQEAGKKYPSIFNTLLVNRNRLWLPRMTKIMSQKPTFFAFGVNHLASETGLISLLEAKGYTLRPIFDEKRSNSALSANRGFSKLSVTAEEYFESGEKKSADGEILDAYNDYSQAIAINRQYAEAYHERGMIRKDTLSDFQGALSDLNKAITINPKYMSAYLNRGFLKSHKLRDYRGAISDFSKVISLDSGIFTAYYERGLLKSSNLDDIQGALSDFDIAIYYSHDHQQSYLARGILKYIKLNDKPGGVADVRRSMQLAQRKDDNLTVEKAGVVLQIMLESEKRIS